MATIREEEVLTSKMTTRAQVQSLSRMPPPADFAPVQGRWLQRKCACGGAPGPSGECAECKRKRLSLQPKLMVNQPNDRFEEEADRAAVAVAGGQSVSARARTGSRAVQRQEAPEKKREQPTQFPVQEQPKEGQAKDDDEKEKLKTGGLKVAEQLGKYLWDQFSNSAAGKSVLAANERDLKPMLKFFEDFADTLAGKVVLGALGTGAGAGAVAGAWATREPSDETAAPSPAAPPSRAPKDEKFFALELKWDFVSPPSGLTVKTPWLDLPEIPLGSQPPAANPALPPPPVLFKAVPKIPRVCTPSDPRGDQGEADARSAFIFWWLRHNQEMAEKKQQELIEGTQLKEPPKYAPSVAQPLFKRERGAEPVDDPAAIKAGLHSPGQPLDSATRRLMESRFGHDFSRVQVHTDARAAEASAAVDARAFTVGRDIVFAAGQFTPGASAGQQLLAHELTHVIQQNEADSLGHNRDLTQSVATGQPLLQRKSAEHSGPAAPAIVDQVLQSSGQPLDSATRTFMERGFGYDFGRVRIYRDAQAAESARAVKANAYTVGSQIVFDSSRYSPETAEGRRLLAHELTHVVQQSAWVPQFSHLLQREKSSAAGDEVSEKRPMCDFVGSAFTNVPDAPIAAKLMGKKLGTQFEVTGHFHVAQTSHKDSLECTCSCGEYQQLVQGKFTKNGQELFPEMCHGEKLEPKKSHEDCKVVAGTVLRFGDRSRLLQSIPGLHNKYRNPDTFFPDTGQDSDKSLGCDYAMKDEPGIQGKSGDQLGMQLDFTGRLINTCNNNEILDSSSWSVVGAATVP